MDQGIFEEHFSAASDDVRARLERIAAEVEKRIPSAQRCISYNMPAYRLDRVFFYFAGFKKHIGVYPPVNGPDKLVEALSSYRGPKGNLIFPHAKPLPLDLIGQGAEHLAKRA